MASLRKNQSFLLSEETKIIPDQEETLSRNDNSRKLKFIAGAYSLPKKDAEKPLGEDAFFICNDKQAIGVGGTAKRGIDSGIYARELMNRAANFVWSHPGSVDPMTVLNHAFERSRSQGASTACIITLKNNNTLQAVNVGDSGFWVIRNGAEIVYKSPTQQAYFNCPFQLGNSTGYSPTDDGDEMTFEVGSGDVIVAATDGLFDNVFDSVITEMVNLCLEASDLAEVMAFKLAKLAREMSLVDDKPSLRTREAVRNGLDMDEYMGGKYNDVTVVVVAYVY